MIALCAVCFATVGAWVNIRRSTRSVQRLGLESRLELLQLQHKSESEELSDPQKREAARMKLRTTEAAIAETMSELSK